MGKYSTHILELVRNNGVAGEVQGRTTTFFMFDYFDLLFYKKLEGENKNYIEYLALNDTFENEKDYKVSFKYLSLYQYQSKETQKPFEVISDGESLSQTPFLGLIQVSLCKDSFAQIDVNEKDIDDFLNLCEDEILQTAKEIGENIQYNVDQMQLYRSSTTGDFCLVLRTDSVEAIYSIALALNNHQKNNNISFLTYTSVGIECCTKKGGGYCTLSQDFVEKHDKLNFVLRFSADYQLENKLKKYQEEKGVLDSWYHVTKGLFGRYDYHLNIGISEFAEIYPVLCERKIGCHNNIDVQYDEIELTLGNIMKYPNIRNVNERILVNLCNVQRDITSNIDEKKRKNIVRQKNDILYEKIVDLKKEYGGYFSEERRAFQDLSRGTVEIFKAFSALGMERDAYVNWLIFYKDMEVLCGCIKQWMECYKQIAAVEEEQKKRLREKVLVNWRVNLQSINQYTRLLQNVNYQTYQSPIYEIQTQIDTEKIMVAYREAMGIYLRRQNPMDMDEEKQNRIYPIIYPDFDKDLVEVKAPFSEKEENLQISEREIVCTVPSFEYFGRLYDLLPWIIHESSHYIRVMERNERNTFLVKYVLSCVFKKMVTDIINEVTRGTVDRNLQIIERKLVKSMVETAQKEVLAEKKVVSEKEPQESDFEQIIKRMAVFLDEICPDERKNLFGNSGQEEQEKREKIITTLLDLYRKQEMLDESIMEEMESLAGKKDGQLNYSEAISKIEKLVERLLKRYGVALLEKLEIVEDESGKEIELIGVDKFKTSASWYEDNLFKCIKSLLQCSKEKSNGVTVIKEYCVLVKQLYALYVKAKELTWQDCKKEERLQGFLEKVYEEYVNLTLPVERDYQKQLNIMMDPDCYYALRCLGLLNGEKKVFCDKMKKLFQRMSGEMLQQYKIFWTGIYREACADLLMVTSLNMTSFGYCRQVLQTISDTKVGRETYDYNDVNYERFRIVTAVLLHEEGVDYEENFSEEEIRVKAGTLVHQAKVYCENTLKCIRKCIFVKLEKECTQNEKISEDLLKEKKELVETLLGTINAQIFDKLEALDENAYRDTLLYALLHEGSPHIGKKSKDKVLKYKEIEQYYAEYKHSLWRLEWLCKGLNNIIQNGYVEVPKRFFEHMCIIREKVKEKRGKGCVWEDKLPVYLLKPKMDVGEFYNDPIQVDQKTSEDKLENTIEFIQNYYYYNRYRMTKGEWDGEKEA